METTKLKKNKSDLPDVVKRKGLSWPLVWERAPIGIGFGEDGNEVRPDSREHVVSSTQSLELAGGLYNKSSSGVRLIAFV